MAARILTAFFFVLINAFCLQSHSAIDPLPQHRVSLQVKQAGLRDALTSVLSGSDRKYKISNNIKNNRVITIEAKNEKWSEVFKKIVAQTQLNYRVTSKNRILVSP